MSLVDTTMNLNAQALAALYFLNLIDVPRDPETNERKYGTRTFAFYNGRERGFTLEVEKGVYSRQRLYLTLFEARAGDSMVIIGATSDKWLDPPTVKDYGNAWETAAYVPFGRLDIVYHVVKDAIDAYLAAPKSLKPEAVKILNLRP
jgi:hypothetical protein